MDRRANIFHPYSDRTRDGRKSTVSPFDFTIIAIEYSRLKNIFESMTINDKDLKSVCGTLLVLLSSLN